MVIKSYVAPSVAGALKLIRAELGSKAVVLKTRGLSARESGLGRRMVEITACLEKPTVGVLSESLADPQSQSKAPSLDRGRDSALSAFGVEESYLTATEKRDSQPKNSESANIESGDSSIDERINMKDASSGSGRPGMVDIRDMESFAKRLEEKLDLILDTHLSSGSISDVTAEVAPLARLLATQDIPERLLRPLLKRINDRMSVDSKDRLFEIAEEVLVAEFAAYSEPGLTLHPGDVALFIGPAGSGKTSVLGKVAVDLLFKKNIKTELSTLDDFRIAAQEEISSYGEALGATFVDADHIVSAVEHAQLSPERALLVDCHSNINDQRQFTRLRERAAALRPTAVFLVISSLTRSADVSRLVRRFESFNPTHLIATHTDLTDTVGGIYAAALDSGLKLCALTNSPGSLGELLAPDPASMARRILERSN